MEQNKSVVALGMFDGMHIGHRALIRRCTELAERMHAEPCAYTFSNHPETVLRGQSPLYLMNAEERRAALERLGVRNVHMEPFTRELSQLEPDAFADRLAGIFDICGVVVGYNYSFGRGGKGTPELLERIGTERGWKVCVVPQVLFSGAAVSSTRIRAALSAGDVALSGELLGVPYTLVGTVKANRGIGRTIGFPTANLIPEEGRALPEDGVYATDASVEGGVYRAVTNVGTNPTVGGRRRTVETHLIGFSGDLYGKRLKVSFLSRIRGEERFPSLDALAARIALDRAAALAVPMPKKSHF